jgi:hypothetical protein
MILESVPGQSFVNAAEFRRHALFARPGPPIHLAVASSRKLTEDDGQTISDPARSEKAGFKKGIRAGIA